MEKLVNLSPESQLFGIAQKVLREHFKDYSIEKIEKIIKINNAGKNVGQYRFVVEYQSEDQSSFDIFKILETDNAL